MGEFIFLVFLALAAGISLGINRSLLGQVGMKSGVINASVINHFSGAIFLFIFILVSSDFSFIESIGDIPVYGLFGGVIGAFFVIITSFVIPRIGVLTTSILFIGGQLFCGIIIDYFLGKVENPLTTVIGLIFILFGVLIGFYNRQSRS